MSEELTFLQNLVTELDDNITIWFPDTILDKTDVMFAAFNNRFAIEDFLIRHAKPTAKMKVALKKFLKIRMKFREDLETFLIVGVEDPNLHTAVGILRLAVSKHIEYLKKEFEPNFVDRISSDQMTIMSQPSDRVDHSESLQITPPANYNVTKLPGVYVRQLKRNS